MRLRSNQPCPYGGRGSVPEPLRGLSQAITLKEYVYPCYFGRAALWMEIT